MKKLNIGTIGLLTMATFGTGLLSPTISHAQNPIYGQGQGYADQIVLDRMYVRREQAKRARRRAAASRNRKHSKKKGSRIAAAPKQNLHVVPAAKVAPASYRYVKFKRDTYQNFHSDDHKGYVVNFTFKPAGGKGGTITKSFNYTYYESEAAFNAIPAGRYTVKAEAKYQNKKYPAYLGSTYGTPTNPTGGNFAPSMTIQVRPGVDAYGYHVLETSPDELYIRVIE